MIFSPVHSVDENILHVGHESRVDEFAKNPNDIFMVL